MILVKSPSLPDVSNSSSRKNEGRSSSHLERIERGMGLGVERPEMSWTNAGRALMIGTAVVLTGAYIWIVQKDASAISKTPQDPESTSGSPNSRREEAHRRRVPLDISSEPLPNLKPRLDAVADVIIATAGHLEARFFSDNVQ